MANNDRLIAYFSMEVALHPEIPTYSGGLGILAGNTLRSAEDLGHETGLVPVGAPRGIFRRNGALKQTHGMDYAPQYHGPRNAYFD